MPTLVPPREIGIGIFRVDECAMSWIRNAKKALMEGLINLSPSCNTAVRLQSEAFLRKLRPTQRAGLGIHLFLCSWCRRYRAQIKKLREVSLRQEHRDDESSAGGTLSPEAKKRIQRSMDDVSARANSPIKHEIHERTPIARH